MRVEVWLPVPNGDHVWNGSVFKVQDLLLGVGEANAARLYAGALPPRYRLCERIDIPPIYGYDTRPLSAFTCEQMVNAAIHLMSDLTHAPTQTEQNIISAKLDQLVKEARRRDSLATKES